MVKVDEIISKMKNYTLYKVGILQKRFKKIGDKCGNALGYTKFIRCKPSLEDKTVCIDGVKYKVIRHIG